MGPQLELGRVIPVNGAETSAPTGVKISAVSEAYTPRDLRPTTTTDHEAIHAGLGKDGEVESVSIIPGPGYRGITKFSRPNALAAMGPHSVGAHGTSWDVMVANHVHGNSGSLESAARHAVHENHAAIVEIADELGSKGMLKGKEIDAARKRARMKLKYGEYATAIARTDTGEELRVRVKVNGDRAEVPDAIQVFSARVKERMNAEAAQKKAAEEQAIRTKEQELASLKSYDTSNARNWSRTKPEASQPVEDTAVSKPAETNAESELPDIAGRSENVAELMKTKRKQQAREDEAKARAAEESERAKQRDAEQASQRIDAVRAELAKAQENTMLVTA